LWFDELNQMILPEHQNNASLRFKFARALSNPVCLCLLLVAVTLVVYWPVTRYDFVNYDDPDYFSSNPHVQAGLTPGNMVWAFCTGYASNWHPLTWLSLMLDRELSGPGPAGPHFTNLVFHAANAVLLFLLLWRLTAATWRSAFVAALFALHPLHVESVAWISERKDVLSTFFGLLALVFYTRYAQKRSGVEPSAPGFAAPESRASSATTESLALDPRRSTLDYYLTLFFFALGLMSKPMLVTLPFLMLLLDYWPLERFKVQGSRFKVQSLVLEKIPFFVLSAISCVVTFIAQQKGGAVTRLARIPMTGRIENSFVSYVRYLDKTLWPASLANPYPHPGHWEFSLVIYSVALVAGLSAIAVLFARRFPFFFTGWFWFIGTLVPVIGLVQVGVQSMADRYTYIPLIGLFIIFVWGLAETGMSRQVPKTLIAVLTVMVLVVSALQTRNQLSYWRDNETLFRHTLAVTKDNYIAYSNLGAWLAKRGRTTEALHCFVKAFRINPNDSDVLYNLGNALTRLGDPEGAVHAYRRALELTPDHADILNNLGFALADKEQYADATACFEKALQLDPNYADAHNNLANVLFYQHKFAEAIPHFRAALRLAPDNPQLHSNLGDALVKQGQTAEAVRCYQEALRLKPGDPQIRAKLQALGAAISN
jgi:Flp pilus assembly protein TadD